MSAANLVYDEFSLDAPSIAPASGIYTAQQTITVTITTAAIGAVLLYTIDGTTPTTDTASLYTGTFIVTAPATIKAIAVGATTSGIAEADFSVREQAQPPTILPAPGTYQGSVAATITTATIGATIHYTTDGTNPTKTSGRLYTGAIQISQTQKIKAIATSTNYANSDVVSASYIITELPTAPTPTISPKIGQYTVSAVVTMQTPLTAGTIYYTLDGSIPTNNSIVYTHPITVTEDTVINAIVVANGYKNSNVASSSYSIVAPQQSYLNIYDFKMGLRKVDTFATDKEI